MLQRSSATRVWGWAAPGSVITVKLGEAEASATTGEDGRWALALDLSKIRPGPHQMEVTGDGSVTVKDVVIGEVWIASGQSNMAWPLSASLGGAEEAAGPARPALRQFLVERRGGAAPAEDVRGHWTAAGPGTAGNFTAVGYYFIKRLSQELNSPAAVINTSWGGSSIEAWTSREALAKDAEIFAQTERINEQVAGFPAKKEAFAAAFRAFLERTGRADRFSGNAAPFVKGDLPDWTPVEIKPGSELPAKPGAIWLRREVELPPESLGSPLRLVLGAPSLFEQVYWNGEHIGGSAFETDILPSGPGRHQVPPHLLRAGKNEIAIRLFSPGKAPSLRALPDAFRAGPVPLEGRWYFRQEFAFETEAPDMPQPPAEPPPQIHQPSRLFNGMIAPLIPVSAAGVIWYQGETNTGRAFQYGRAFPLMINDWRERWGNPKLPFYWCQLANFMQKEEAPGESGWAELREAQTLTLALPASGQAVLIDLGEASDIHPRDKKSAGERLAAIALARSYNRDVPFTGPVYAGYSAEGGKIILRFSDTGGGLTARELPAEYPLTTIPPVFAPLRRNSPGSELEGFAICGEDRKWVWASAKIEGDTVVVWSDAVPSPVAVRYAWANNPTGNLYGKNGLPAGPFRTDSFPGVTEGKP